MTAAPMDGAIVLGPGEWRVAGDPDAMLACIGLGSCVSISLHEPTARVSGMAHMVLPDGSTRWRRHGSATFIDFAVPMLVENMLAAGAVCSAIRADLVGGAAMLAATDTFPHADVGARNVTAAREALERQRLCVRSNETGGCNVCTVRLHVGTGRVQVTTADGGMCVSEWQRGEPRHRTARGAKE